MSHQISSQIQEQLQIMIAKEMKGVNFGGNQPAPTQGFSGDANALMG